jgi:hypothetical protein
VPVTDVHVASTRCVPAAVGLPRRSEHASDQTGAPAWFCTPRGRGKYTVLGLQSLGSTWHSRSGVQTSSAWSQGSQGHARRAPQPARVEETADTAGGSGPLFRRQTHQRAPRVLPPGSQGVLERAGLSSHRASRPTGGHRRRGRTRTSLSHGRVESNPVSGTVRIAPTGTPPSASAPLPQSTVSLPRLTKQPVLITRTGPNERDHTTWEHSR